MIRKPGWVRFSGRMARSVRVRDTRFSSLDFPNRARHHEIASGSSDSVFLGERLSRGSHPTLSAARRNRRGSPDSPKCRSGRSPNWN